MSVRPGNAAKVRVQTELSRRLHGSALLRVLDVGCVGSGPTPLALWRPLLDGTGRVELVGIDVQGIDRARSVVAAAGWHGVDIRPGSAYALLAQFGPASFDLIVSTQVLEHLARLSTFLAEASAVLRPGGECLLTADSGDWRPRYSWRHPMRLLTNLGKKALAVMGWEGYYDLPWTEAEITHAAQTAGFDVLAIRYYDLPPLKMIHNHLIPPEQQDEFLTRWSALEDWLNDRLPRERGLRRFCMDFFIHLRKS